MPEVASPGLTAASPVPGLRSTGLARARSVPDSAWIPRTGDPPGPKIARRMLAFDLIRFNVGHGTPDS
jgi:hypothetical protein